MKSAFAVTYKIEDPVLAAQELASKIKSKLQFARNSCCILFAEIPFELNRLLPELEKKLKLPVIGITSAAQISAEGYHRLSATLMVLTADDCNFSMALSKSLQGDCKAEIANTYNKAAAGLFGEEPELIFLFTGFSKDILDDDLISEMNKLSNGKPVFGGVSSDYNIMTDGKVFLGSEISSDGLALLLISGNIKPKFTMGMISPNLITKAKITNAHLNEIFTIDNQIACTYLKKNGVDLDSPYSLFFHPLSLDFKINEESLAHPVDRAITNLNKEKGSAICKTHIPEGASLSVCNVSGKDIEESTRDAFVSMKEKYVQASSDGYEYTTMLGISCVARHIVLAYDYAQEGLLANQLLPEGINFMGCYSFGEYSPVSVNNSPDANMTHNISIALCMF